MLTDLGGGWICPLPTPQQTHRLPHVFTLPLFKHPSIALQNRWALLQEYLREEVTKYQQAAIYLHIALANWRQTVVVRSFVWARLTREPFTENVRLEKLACYIQHVAIFAFWMGFTKYYKSFGDKNFIAQFLHSLSRRHCPENTLPYNIFMFRCF